ncbi:MAG: carbohydrate ABC transporter permease [Burkholderia sp.]|jgi:trehalose/maltose transport system permease protein|uniref:carbohydrate ABC transporter permease n=1 Tax=Burkholderia sp. TaxID=36773 RepID=UPI00258DA8F7|nr:carbohydrate ABC transporter permease [Burkholderia sp.]MCA3777545.1 carbohydrate ABC transporter permease [Burkholderia sp.]MCA3784740.1 carbohydrate ABC transporter permease [Burkholderia sp.]MCA3792488.1 carbohydrate ABC transporter permease [Burkholderia sp.]MCA3801411.1 carbohydrate ABC transporter permease [Burkholderia sp.]MCA3812626.1 carbohydrate ABC transporter permease [Burkholderia sp.]
MKKHPLETAVYGVLSALVLVIALFPLVYMIGTSVKHGDALFDTSLFPASPSLDNYRQLFRDQPFGAYLLNSALVAGGAVALSLAVSVLAAYALGRVSFRGRGVLMMCILGVSMFPQVAILSGLFELIRALGLYDNLGALVLSDLIFTLPFTIWILVTFMRELPGELEDAARVDGVGVFTLIFRIFLPLLRPALAATSLLAFVSAWNEFLFALTFTISSSERTVPVAITMISGASSYELPWGTIMAASAIVTVPLVLLVMLCQRHIVSGLTAGAVKG